MSATPYSIGEHPQSEPEPDQWPCPKCEGMAADRLVTDALNDMLNDEKFPVRAVREFLDRWAGAWNDMAEFLRAEAENNGGEFCADHMQTQNDTD